MKKRVTEGDYGHDKVTLVLSAHSRGCLSALLWVKKLNADKDLRSRIDIVLDLRDPVPGNFSITANLDIAKITTMASKLYDLSACANVKEAHITIQEKGIMDIAFLYPSGGLIEMSAKSIKKNLGSQTNWAKVHQKEDADINYDDSPASTAKFCSDAELVMPEHKIHLSVRLDEGIVDYFKKDGRGYQSRINTLFATGGLSRGRIAILPLDCKGKLCLQSSI